MGFVVGNKLGQIRGEHLILSLERPWNWAWSQAPRSFWNRAGFQVLSGKGNKPEASFSSTRTPHFLVGRAGGFPVVLWAIGGHSSDTWSCALTAWCLGMLRATKATPGGVQDDLTSRIKLWLLCMLSMCSTSWSSCTAGRVWSLVPHMFPEPTRNSLWVYSQE